MWTKESAAKVERLKPRLNSKVCSCLLSANNQRRGDEWDASDHQLSTGLVRGRPQSFIPAGHWVIGRRVRFGKKGRWKYIWQATPMRSGLEAGKRVQIVTLNC